VVQVAKGESDLGKKISFSSPLGIAIAAAGLILALSPQARSAVRRLMVKGTATAMDAMEQVGGLTAGLMSKTSAGAGRQDSTEAEREVERSIQPAASPTSTPEQTTDTEEHHEATAEHQEGTNEGDTV
jgi:hypothetical protein